jgi:hypothetical protein
VRILSMFCSMGLSEKSFTQIVLATTLVARGGGGSAGIPDTVNVGPIADGGDPPPAGDYIDNPDMG